MSETRLVDREAYDEHYSRVLSDLYRCVTVSEFRERYEREHISPFFRGGKTKGYVRGEAVRALLDSFTDAHSRNGKLVIDAGCGHGELSIYLGCLGFNVIGVDISSEVCRSAAAFADRLGIAGQVKFLAASLEDLNAIGPASVDGIIGHASLHHFIKYDNVPREFLRVMKAGAGGYFADSFGENRLYHLFHDKAQMQRLGDVVLTKSLIESYWRDFEYSIVPVDWMVMLDKFYLKVFPKRMERLVRKVSRIHFELDRHMPINRATLWLSGSVMTAIRKPA